MASCSTPRWVSTAPYVKLTVTLNTDDSTGNRAVYDWKLQYIASSAAQTSVNKSYTVKIQGNTLKTGTYDIDGKVGTYTIATGQYTAVKQTAARDMSFYVSFEFNITWSGTYGGTKTASGSIEIPKKTSYAVKYNANGGSGGPSTQTKWYGSDLTISSTEPTRTGYTFKGWGTTSTDTSVNYNPGDVYTTEKAITLYAIWKANAYTVSYNPNDGSGAPSNQTKWHDTALTLSATTPIRTGYIFQGWGTSPTDTSVDYAPGATYSTNAEITLYAIWKASEYTVAYNANGGSGTPSNQTKTYDVPLVLSTVEPTRTDYKFEGWGTSQSTSAVTYAPGATYSTNAEITLYAVWTLDYIKPRIYGLVVNRCSLDSSSNPVLTDIGTYALVEFNWETDKTVTSITIEYKLSDATAWSQPIPVDATGVNGKITKAIGGSFDTDRVYDIRVTVYDESGSTPSSTILPGTNYIIDILAEGKGIAFGKPAEKENTMEVGYDASFEGAVYGKVMGLDALPKIEDNSDLNDILETGCYSVRTNASAKTIANIPVKLAGRLDIWVSTGSSVKPNAWAYLRQRFTPFSLNYGVYERDITRDDTNAWSYGNWICTSVSKVVLFEGSSNATINLSKEVESFVYLEIFFTDNNGICGGYTKLAYPFTNPVDLSILEVATSSATYIRRTRYTISGTTMTPDLTKAGYVSFNNTSVSHVDSTVNRIKIKKVVGHYA